MSHRKETEAMAPQPIEDWACIPWRKLERSMYRLQKRIYQASLRGNDKAVHNLQRLLMKSKAARTLAVRKVTQDNQGKRTAGIDGVKSVEPVQRLVMVQRLRHHKTIKPQPTRRVWIPKPGKTEQRPLGIPTMLDRAHQCLVKLALEPEWEARFEANSYGFRPGRSVHDAIAAIYNIIVKQPKYVLDADIANCFNNINHTVLPEKLHTFPAMRRVIQAWLKAGVLDGEVFAPTEAGTPQGGPLAPLFANEHANPKRNKLILLTKTTNTHYLADIRPEHRSQVVVSFSLNPESIADLWEGKWSDTQERITPPISKRLEAAKYAQDLGFDIRVRIDPILTPEGWENAYAAFFAEIKQAGIAFQYWTLGTYREKNIQLDAWRERWGLPPMEWQPSGIKQDGTHRHLAEEQRISIYRTVSTALYREFPRARVSLCKETHTVRKALALCNADCNCLV